MENKPIIDDCMKKMSQLAVLSNPVRFKIHVLLYISEVYGWGKPSLEKEPD